MIRYANKDDAGILEKYDVHIAKDELEKSIDSNRVIVMFDDEENFVGWLRYNLFWDNTPFMNMLYFLEDYRGRGYGSKLVSFWENEMKNKGYKLVLTSTQSNEDAQFFYRKIGYIDNGSFQLPDEPVELILYKCL